jgi:M6 family metalloprotease-like protein
VVLTGTTFDWEETPLTRQEVTAGESGLGTGSRVGEYIFRALESLDDGTVDWGQFDNDGPDGIPNSGDDDGFVDVLAVMHPTPGGECFDIDRANRIWSHRWTLYWNAVYSGSAWTPWIQQSVLENVGYVTKSPSANPGEDFVRVLDYTIQPVRTCGGSDINYIGVFAHELGHGFGLPDLYVTASNENHEGIGNWGLMGTGSWGCDGQSAWSPCHMCAWSKEVLGWADIQVIEPGTDLGSLDLLPVETSGDVYRIDSGDGSSEYLLLENRQRSGFDEYLYEPGLLVWHIDPETIGNSPGGINNDPDRMGVWLRQADGQNDLGAPDGGRGDAGDPFPGLFEVSEFHAGSIPGSWTHDGNTMGITLLDIAQIGEDMSFRTLTRYQTLNVRTEGSPSGSGLVSVDGGPPGPADRDVASAPFQSHVLEAAPGEETEGGVRVGFQGWTDGAPRIREHTTELEDASFTATYGGFEYFLNVTPTSPAQGITPGYVDFLGGGGDGWVPEGETATVTATARTGFQFREWGGGFAGMSNPATVVVTAPLQAEARFDVIFTAQSNPSAVEVVGGFPHTLTLTVENANKPVTWSVAGGGLPDRMELQDYGAITGTPLFRGEFPVTFRVRDLIGLEALLPLTLVIQDPDLPVDALGSAFLLTGPPLNADTRIYLDNEGNRNSAFDLGDFRAYVLRNPDRPASGPVEALVEKVVIVGDMTRTPPGGEVKREDGP